MLAKVAGFIIVAGLVIYALVFFVYRPHTAAQPAHTYAVATITIGTTTIEAKIADTEALREQGLSGTAPLAAGQGMLFVFQSPGNYGFWMKDMNYSLDIIWLNASSTVTTIWPDLSPQTYPQAFYPATPDALYVIEVPAGFAAQSNIKVGDQMQISK